MHFIRIDRDVHLQVPRRERTEDRVLVHQAALGIAPAVLNEALGLIGDLGQKKLVLPILEGQGVLPFDARVDQHAPARLAATDVECEDIAFLADPDALDLILQRLEAVGEIDTDKQGTDNLAARITHRLVARHVIAAEQPRPTEVNLTPEQERLCRVRIAEGSPDRTLAILALERGCNAIERISLAHENRGDRPERGREAVERRGLAVQYPIVELQGRQLDPGAGHRRLARQMPVPVERLAQHFHVVVGQTFRLLSVGIEHIDEQGRLRAHLTHRLVAQVTPGAQTDQQSHQ